MVAAASSLSVKHPDQIALERELGVGAGTVGVPWTEQPYQNIDTGRALLGHCSRGQVYKLEREGKLRLFRLARRVVIPTEDIIALLRKIEPWTPDGKTRAAVTQRARNTLAKTDQLIERHRVQRQSVR